MEFAITKRAKSKARMLRIHKEKKWLPFRIIYITAFIASTLSLLMGLLLPNEEFMKLDVLGLLFALFLIVGVVAISLELNFARHWIQDRYNERLWIDDNSLCLLYQMPWGAGWNARSLDDTAVMYQIRIATIRKVSYDELTKRIVIYGQGVGRRLDSLSQWHVNREWPLTEKYKMVVYDYYQPSLVTALEQRGIEITKETLDFKIIDNTHIGNPAKHGARPL